MKNQKTSTASSTATVPALTIDQAKELAAKEKLTLRQLRSVLPSTKGVKTPTREWVRQNLDGNQVFFKKEYPNGDRMVIFMNGFFSYGTAQWNTTMRVDGFRELYFEVDENGGYNKLPEKVYIDGSCLYPLGECAIWQLKRNSQKRDMDGGEDSTDPEILQTMMDGETPTLEDMFIARESDAEEKKRLKDAWNKLTDQQKAVVRGVILMNRTQHSVAEELGVNRQRVTAVLKQSLKKIRKNFD